MKDGATEVSVACTTVDAGNGSARFVHWDEHRSAGTPLRVEYGPSFEADAARAMASAPVALVSCVAGADVRAAIARAAANVGVKIRDRHHGLDTSACRNLHTIGADRLWAARGAVELGAAPCLVVDVGTAVTVDAVVSSRGASGAFLGGAIAPGPDLLRRALGAGAAQLFEVDLPGVIESDVLARVPALGRESSEALRAGVVHGLRGAVRELVLEVAREAGIDPRRCLSTGGAAGWILAEPAIVPPSLHHPLLVHRGLLAAHDAAAS